MNSASRLESVFKKFLATPHTKTEDNQTKHIILIDTWKQIFECETIFEVYENLLNLDNEISRLEKEVRYINLDEPSKQTVDNLKTISTFPNLSAPMQSFKAIISDKELHTLSFINSILESNTLKDEHIYQEVEIDLSKFIENIELLLTEIQQSDIDDEDKVIFVSFLADLQKGTRLYSIRGVDALIKALQDNLCKYKLVEEKLTGKYEKFKENTHNLIGEIVFWAQTIKKSKKSYTQLKGAVSGMIDLNENEDDRVIDVEEDG